MTAPKGRSAKTIRQNEIAQIHIARTKVGMDEDTYRAMLQAFGVKSSKDLDWTGRKRVLAHFKEHYGWKPRPPQGAKQPIRADDAQSKMIRGLWLELHGVGEVRDPSEKALGAYVFRIAKVQALEWLSNDQASKVIETLKAWLERVTPEDPETAARRASLAKQAAENPV